MGGPYVEEGSTRGNHLRASLRGHRRLEMECRREQQHMQEGHHTRHDSDKGSSQGNKLCLISLRDLISMIGKKELENLQKQVKDLEIKLKGQQCRRE